MIVHLTAEVKAIGYIISEIDLKRGRNEKLATETFQKCVAQTINVLKIRDMLERSCSFMIFIQHTLDTLMICTIVFIIPKVNIS